MNGWGLLCRLALADFLERIRSYGFLITIGATAYMGYLALPPATAGYSVMSLGGSRGVYNSPWVGTTVALFSTVVLLLPGFYLVSNAVDRDRRTGVGQILASTAVSHRIYLVGKFCSNAAVLSLMTVILAVMTSGMQLLRGEEIHIKVVSLLLPFLILTMPALLLVSALAVLFESVRWLSGAFGRVAYFFLWMAMLAPVGQVAGASLDAVGLWYVYEAIRTVLVSQNPAYQGGFTFLGNDRAVPTFSWEGLSWRPEFLLTRILVIGLAFVCLAVAMAAFDRFADRRTIKPWRTFSREKPRVQEQVQERQVRSFPSLSHLRALSGPPGFSLGGMTLAELRLMGRSVPPVWYAAAISLLVVGAAAPLHVSTYRILPLAWLLPLTMWSAMGSREMAAGLQELLFSAPRLLTYQFPALWLAGACVALATGSVAGVRLILAGDWPRLLGWGGGILFIPSLALAIGTWTGSSKAFEVIYLLLWYLGAWQQMPLLDFTGQSGPVSVWLPLACVTLVAAAYLGRRRQVGAQ